MREGVAEANLVFCATFGLEWLVGLLLASRRGAYLTNVWLLADLVSALPLTSLAQAFRLARFARLIRLSRMLKLLRARRFGSPVAGWQEPSGWPSPSACQEPSLSRPWSLPPWGRSSMHCGGPS